MRTLLLLLPLLAGCPPSDTPKDTATDTDAGLVCGTSTCGGAEVCVQEDYAPACEDHTDTAAPCPDGTTATMCGGAGYPCCCEPPPPMTYQCQDASACGDTPSCTCVTCPSGKECMSVGSETSGVYQCSEPAKP